MVIPIGGGGGMDGDDGGGMGGMLAPMMGAPPPELRRYFTIIKFSLVGQIIGTVVLLGAGIPLAPGIFGTTILNALQMLLQIVVGIFLLMDDPMFAGCYRCLVQSFCQSCGGERLGGMSCLCSWWFINLLSVILAAIPGGGSLFVVISGFFPKGNTAWNQDINWGVGGRNTMTWKILFYSYFGAEVLVLLSQLIGGWVGLKAFRETQTMQANGLSGNMNGAGGGQDGWSAGGRGGGDTGGARDFGGGRLGDGGGAAGGGGGGAYRAGGGGAASQGGQAQQPAFQPFAGQGNRLGS